MESSEGHSQRQATTQLFSVQHFMTSQKKNLGAVNQPTDLTNSSANNGQSSDSTGSDLHQESASKSKFWQRIQENLQIIAIALALALLIRAFVAEPRYIPSDSMLPTLEVGDRLVVEKLSYRFHPPASGEIIVFDPPQQLQIQGYAKDQAFIKRVIATPGQLVQVQDGKVYLDGTPLEEDYIAEPPNYQMPSVRVPDDYLFVMGDNRNNSNDSHVWGFLPKQNVIGHACFRFWPLSRIGQV